jgi:hypothetical protein
MGLLSNTLNNLKQNVIGSVLGKLSAGVGTGGVAPILRKAAIGMDDSSPLATLGNDPLAFSSLAYPKDVTDDMTNGHYMVFYVNIPNQSKVDYKDGATSAKVGEYVRKNKLVTDAEGKISYKTLPQGVSPGGPGFSSPVQAIKDKVNAKLSGFGTGATSALGTVLRKQGHTGATKNTTGMSARMNLTKRISDSVTLYLPPNVQDVLNATYNSMATGLAGAAMAGAAAAAGAYNNDDFEKSIKSGLDVAGGVMSDALAKSAAGVAETLTGGEGLREAGLKGIGAADNPYMEVLFDKVGMREFNYSFTFAPKNPDESEDIKKIINLFRFHMLPELRGNAARFLTIPSEFDIHYMFMGEDGAATENTYYHKISTCVLQSLSVDYTPNGVKSFSNGAPTQINLSLSFKETRAMNKQLVNEGF